MGHAAVEDCWLNLDHLGILKKRLNWVHERLAVSLHENAADAAGIKPSLFQSKRGGILDTYTTIAVLLSKDTHFVHTMWFHTYFIHTFFIHTCFIHTLFSYEVPEYLQSFKCMYALVMGMNSWHYAAAWLRINLDCWEKFSIDIDKKNGFLG